MLPGVPVDAAGAPRDAAPARPHGRPWVRSIVRAAVVWSVILAGLILLLGGGQASEAPGPPEASGPMETAETVLTEQAFESPGEAVLFTIAVVILLGLSAFFSGSEVAFFSLHRLRLRAMAEEENYVGRLISRMMDDPNGLLTTILAGNAVVNVGIGVVLGTKIDLIFLQIFSTTPLPAGIDGNAAAYVLAVVLTTVALVLFGEIIPKVVAVTASEPFARITAIPMRGADRLLKPLSNACIAITDFLFRVTRVGQLRAAPFITDDELKRVLFETGAQGVIHEQDMQMIQGILEISEANLRSALTPRGDIIAIEADATVADALELLREHRFSRLPVYEEDLDHIIGILVMKDLLPSFARGDFSQPVRSLMRKAHFVPEVMSVNNFIKDAQRRRFHLSIVVDEYGGTAGLITLEDAMEEIVGEIFDESDEEVKPYEELEEGVYRVEGDMPLDEFSVLVGKPIEHDQHHTVAGYLMGFTERLLEEGEVIETDGLRFRVEELEGRRVAFVRVEALPAPEVAETAEGPDHD